MQGILSHFIVMFDRAQYFGQIVSSWQGFFFFFKLSNRFKCFSRLWLFFTKAVSGNEQLFSFDWPEEETPKRWHH